MHYVTMGKAHSQSNDRFAHILTPFRVDMCETLEVNDARWPSGLA